MSGRTCLSPPSSPSLFSLSSFSPLSFPLLSSSSPLSFYLSSSLLFPLLSSHADVRKHWRWTSVWSQKNNMTTIGNCSASSETSVTSWSPWWAPRRNTRGQGRSRVVGGSATILHLNPSLYLHTHTHRDRALLNIASARSSRLYSGNDWTQSHSCSNHVLTCHHC